MVQANHPTTEWTSLQDIFYRRTELYALNWGIDNLADYVVAASSNGGLIALIRDPTRLVSLGKASLLKPKILVYTAAGQLIESIPWDHSLRIVALDFNALEQLVVVLEEGNVRLYTLLSPCPASADGATSTASSRSRPVPVEATSNSYYTQHSLGTEATETGVLDARVWAGGLVAFVGARRFVEWRFPGLDVDAESGEYAGAVGLSGGGEYGFALPSFDVSLGAFLFASLLLGCRSSQRLAIRSHNSTHRSGTDTALPYSLCRWAFLHRHRLSRHEIVPRTLSRRPTFAQRQAVSSNDSRPCPVGRQLQLLTQSQRI